MKSIIEYLTEAKDTNILTLNPYNAFILVKPGFTKLATSIIDMFKSKGATIAKYGARRMTKAEAEEFYSMHKDKDFYNDLCKYMSSGVCVGYLIDMPGDEPIKAVSYIKDDVRKTYGKDDMKNVLHSSDSKDNVNRESRIFFRGM